jgi:hypothetical protein
VPLNCFGFGSLLWCNPPSDASVGRYLATDNVTLFTTATPLMLWWQGLIHDLSRFRPSELIGYARAHGAGLVKRDRNGYYAGSSSNESDVERQRERALMWHWYRNPHHWEHWAIVLPTTHLRFKEETDEDGVVWANTDENPTVTLDTKLIDMPERYLLECACDWWGASMAQGMGGKIYQRYLNTKGQTIHLSDKNRDFFQKSLQIVETLMNGEVYRETTGS